MTYVHKCICHSAFHHGGYDLELKENSIKELTNLYKVLTDETRLRIIFLLYMEELCVCEITGILEVPQPAVSRNLAKLRDMGLVTDLRKERFIYYQLKKEKNVLLDTLHTLQREIENYPQLQEDFIRLKDKAQFTLQCKIE